jgi:hypothetical protein
MKYLLITLLLAGCSTVVPVKQKFPEAPPALKEKCEQLKQVQGSNVSITDLLKVVVQNYTLYHECSTKVEGWQEWYTEQERIFKDVK